MTVRTTSPATYARATTALLAILATSGCALLLEPIAPPEEDATADLLAPDLTLPPDLPTPDLPDACLARELECADDPTAGDGLDNDCDGITDEGCHCAYEGLTTGICARGLRSGDDGTCRAPAFFVAVEVDLCDGEDNDCDGEVDEGCTCTYLDLTDGVCPDATLAMDLTCAAPDTYVPDESAEHCDMLDNDCDGATDEGCPCDVEGRRDGLCEGLVLDDKGVCPVPMGYVDREDDCDGVDNDCDGETDEGCFLNQDPGAPLEIGATIQLDFGDEAPASTEWHQVGNCTNPLSRLEDLTDTQGRPTRIDLRWRFSGSNGAGPDMNEVGFPTEVSGDSCWVGDFGGHEAGMTKQGGATFDALDPRHTYTLVTYSARQNRDQGNDRLTRVTVTGQVSTTQEIDAVDNTTTLMTFPDLRPAADGTLTIDIAVSPNGTGRFSYLNAAILTRAM